MEVKSNKSLPKILYAILFILVLPLLLFLWAVKTDTAVTLPAFENPAIEIAMATAGLLIMLSGMCALVVHGRGLPMNPYPPQHFVTGGIYGLIPHPIYSGACLLAIGVSIYAHSASGLWLISPVLILSCIAIVLGFEKDNLAKRFPDKNLRPRLSIPEASAEPPTVWNKISAYILVLIPWLIFYRIAAFLNIVQTPVSGNVPFFSDTSHLTFTVTLQFATFLLAIAAPLFARTRQDLRAFMISGLLATAAGFYIPVIFPFVTPAFSVIWIFIAMSLFAKRFPKLRLFWRLMAIVISISCLLTGLNLVIDVISGFGIYLFAEHRASVWRQILHMAETIAGSWKEWQFGHIRMMNHGLYGGSATFVGITMVGLFIGKSYLPAMLTVVVTTLLCAALWAQFIEGSKKLLRPLGFYGGILGVIFGCGLAHLLFGVDFFLLWAPFAVAAPWIQAIGRLRCLVQGCCHGRPAAPNAGIRYFHPRSRVVGLANLKGEYLHATPVYSILANVVYGMFLIKLWFSSVPLPFIIGMSFIFNGLSRFVEESYRGEPQTPIIKGLRLYQWGAVSSIILGAGLTAIPYNVLRSGIHINVETFIAAIIAALLTTFVTGVDFPRSNKRFSRLV